METWPKKIDMMIILDVDTSSLEATVHFYDFSCGNTRMVGSAREILSIAVAIECLSFICTSSQTEG